MGKYVYRVSELVTDNNILIGIGLNLDITRHKIDQIRDDNPRFIHMAAIEIIEKSRLEIGNDVLFIEHLNGAFKEMGLETIQDIPQPPL